MNGHIRERSPGHYELRYRANGKTRTATVKGGKREAERELRRLLSLVDSNQHPNDPDRLTVGEWLVRWLETIKPEVAAQTWANYETMVRTRIAPALGTISLSRLSPADLQRFYTQITQTGLKASSAAHVGNVLNIGLARAVEQHIIATHPGEAVRKRKPRPAAPAIGRPALDRDQCAQLLAAARETDLYPLVLIALATGMRRNEILALRWDDIDFDGAEINVQHSIVHMRGITTRKAPKNGKARVVTIPAPVIAELRRLKLEQAEALLRLGVRPGESTPVCMRGADGAVRSPVSVTLAFQRLIKRIGFAAVSFHALRHTHATELMRAGVSVNVAAARLGHSDGGVLLLKTYAHTTNEMARDAARRIEGFFAKL